MSLMFFNEFNKMSLIHSILNNSIPYLKINHFRAEPEILLCGQKIISFPEIFFWPQFEYIIELVPHHIDIIIIIQHTNWRLECWCSHRYTVKIYFFFFNYNNIHAYKQIDIYELIKIKKTGPNAFNKMLVMLLDEGTAKGKS